MELTPCNSDDWIGYTAVDVLKFCLFASHHIIILNVIWSVNSYNHIGWVLLRTYIELWLPRLSSATDIFAYYMYVVSLNQIL